MEVSERWLPIKGYESSYEISTQGRIRSISKVDALGRQIIGKTLKLGRQTNGYRQIHLYKEGIRVAKRVHRLVLETFLGESALDVNHKDLNKDNNRLDNLEYITKSDNSKHWRASKKYHSPTRCKMSKAEVILARELYSYNKEAFTCIWLAKCFKLSKSAMGAILARSSWRHI